jgi:hypothetical protein
VYDPTHIARKDTGAYKTNSQNGLPLIAITASGIHARRETLLLKQNYDLTAAYLDIQSYGSPSHGVDGDHIDQLATSPWAKSMRQGILDQKLWMRDMTDTLEGPMMGEGSIATQHSNLEWLWGGYCDSVQRVINTGSLTVASNQPLGDPDSPTLWPVIPEFELRVMKPLQVNHGNGFYERFFSRSDTGMTTSNGQPILPATTAMLDRYRVYEITYGHSAFFATSGPWDVPNNRLSFANMIKEYYMMHSLQSRYFSSNVKSIKYLYNNQLLNFARVIAQTETVDTFRDARIRIEYHNGLEVYVNHGVGSWSLSVGNVAYVIPQDGFVAYQPSTNFVAFSAVPPGTGGQRIDYCFAPGEYEFFDGRGTVAGYGNINTGTVKKLKLTNFINGKTVQQNSSGSIQVTQGVVPAVTSVELIPGANPIAVGDRVSVKALAHFNNGAFRAVTSLVNWSSTNPTVASVNEGGAIFAHLPGTTTITATNYQGVTAPALVVTVN